MGVISYIHRVRCHQSSRFDYTDTLGIMSDTVVVLSFIHSGEISYTLSIMSKTLQVSCHSYSGCDVTSVVYVLSYTVGLYSRIEWINVIKYRFLMSERVVVMSHRIHMMSYI